MTMPLKPASSGTPDTLPRLAEPGANATTGTATLAAPGTNATTGTARLRPPGESAIAAGDGFEGKPPVRHVDVSKAGETSGTDAKAAVKPGSDSEASVAKKLQEAVPAATSSVDATKPEAYTRSTAAALTQRTRTIEGALEAAKKSGQKTIFIPPLGVREAARSVLEADAAHRPSLSAVERGMRDVKGTPEAQRFQAAIAKAREAGIEVVVGQNVKEKFDNRTDVLSNELGLPKRSLDWRDRALHDLYGPTSKGFAFDTGSALSTPQRSLH